MVRRYLAFFCVLLGALAPSCGDVRQKDMSSDGGPGGIGGAPSDAAGDPSVDASIAGKDAAGGSGAIPGEGGAMITGAGGTFGSGGVGGGSAGRGGTSGGGGATTSGGATDTGGTASASGGTTGLAGVGGSPGAGGAGGVDNNRIALLDATTATFNSWVSALRPAANPWRNNGDGTMSVVVGTGDIQSTMKFQDLFVHLEYMTPVVQATDPPLTNASRGSGVYLKGSYEMQILDTYGQAPAMDGCGAVYGIRAPLETACFIGGEWNTYEIEFKAQVCSAQGQRMANARIVWATLNGRMVQQDVELPTATKEGQLETCNPAGLMLQENISFKPMMFRNIWVIPRQ